VAREALEDAYEPHSLDLGQWSQEVLLGRLDCALGFGKASLAFGGQFDQVTPAVGRIAGANDQPVPFERIKQAHEVARIDPQGRAELLLRERPCLLEVMKHGELVISHVQSGKSLGQTVAGRPRQPEDQDRGAGGSDLFGDS
jgi:hypothetical protein